MASEFRLDRNQGDFIAFLHWLDSEHMYEVDDIIYVVEKPWKYEDEYNQYLNDKEEQNG